VSSPTAGNYDKRLGKVETEIARQGERLEGFDDRIDRLEGAVAKVGTGVETLLHREATRPPPTNWRTAAFTVFSMLGGVSILVGFSWWFTSVSPAVLDLRERVGKLDDREVGRMPRAERRLDELERWAPRVVKH